MTKSSLFLKVCLLAVTGCTSTGSSLQYRPAGLSAATVEPGNLRIVLERANAQLALGNTGLALELYRKAVRKEPTSLQAQLGLARSYQAMGRHDLARRSLEVALAARPGDQVLLTQLAKSLEHDGLLQEASSVRVEIAALTAGQQNGQVAGAVGGYNGAPSTSAQEQLNQGVQHAVTSVGALSSVGLGSSVTVDLRTAPSGGQTNLRAVTGGSITVALAPSVPTSLPSSGERKRTRRLERVSLQEVVLRTAGPPRFAALNEVARHRGLLKSTKPFEPALRVLNAARVAGLASRTRLHLAQLGWRSIIIGDARIARARTLLIYPAGKELFARRIAAQFRHPISLAKGGSMTLLVGSDAVPRQRKTT